MVHVVCMSWTIPIWWKLGYVLISSKSDRIIQIYAPSCVDTQSVKLVMPRRSTQPVQRVRALTLRHHRNQLFVMVNGGTCQQVDDSAIEVYRRQMSTCMLVVFEPEWYFSSKVCCRSSQTSCLKNCTKHVVSLWLPLKYFFQSNIALNAIFIPQW